jgi:biopolymer transport protein ExbD
VRSPQSSLAGLDRDYGGMTPMIDVVFNLLIFFVVGAGSFAADKLLATRLSATGGSAASSKAVEERPVWALTVDLSLKLNAAGQAVVDMNGTVYADRDSLKTQLKALAEVGPESPINLDIAADVPLGDMIDVYDACRASGFETINFVTRGK